MINLWPDTSSVAHVFGLICVLAAIGAWRAAVRSYLAHCEERMCEPDFRLLTRFFRQQLRIALLAYVAVLFALEREGLRTAHDLWGLVAREYGISHAAATLAALTVFQLRLRVLPPVALQAVWRVVRFTIGTVLKALPLGFLDLPEGFWNFITRIFAVIGIWAVACLLYPSRELRERLRHKWQSLRYRRLRQVHRCHRL